MNHYDALKLLALRAVMKPDSDARFRNICRWYSITFHTPLHMVEELPEEDILVAYYETTYEELDDQDRVELLKELTETDEDRRRKSLAKDREEAESFEFARQIANEEKQKQPKTKLSEVRQPERPPSSMSRAAALPQSKPAFEKLEPDVTVKFVEAEEFEKELEGFGTMSPKEAK